MTKLALSLLGVSGVSISSIGIAYLLHKDTIGNLYSEDLLGENESEDGKQLQLKLNKDETVDNSIMKDVQNKEQTTSVENGDKLKEGCKSVKSESINMMYPTFHQRTIQNYVSKYCIRPIGEKLTSGTLFTAESSDHEAIKKKHKELSSHTGDPELNSELQIIKSEYKEGEFQKFLDGCIAIYKRGYKSSNHSNGKLADKFCKKN